MFMNRGKVKRVLEEYTILTVATLILVVGVYLFKFPNHFSFGGVTGVAVVLSAVMPATPGNITFVINMLLLVVGFLFLGKSFGVRTVYVSVLIFVAHPRYLPFLGVGAAGIGFVGIFLSMESYRLERLAVWRNPEQYEKGFQTIQGLYAIGSGGIFGKGLGSSLQKLGFVPEAQNDMIFSIICEETGLLGAVLVMLIFGLLIWRLMVNAVHAQDLLGRKYS